jgi:putative phage-type endonuclease
MQTENEKSDRLDWLKWRQSGLGGSDIMQILLPDEVRPYGGPWDVWLSKKQEVVMDEANAAMGIGNWLERPIAQWVADETKSTLIDAEAVQGPEDWMRCTPDFWLKDASGAQQGLECKVSSKGGLWSAGVPDYVYLQALWCMICTDTNVWHVGAYLPGSWKRAKWVVERDAAKEKEVIKKTRDWWTRHIVNGEVPDVDGSIECMKGLYNVYPEPKEAAKPANDDEQKLIEDLIKHNDILSNAQKEVKRIKNQLALAAGDNVGIYSDLGRFTWSRQKGITRLDSKRLKADRPDLYEQFSKTSEPSRVARFTKKKEDTK